MKRVKSMLTLAGVRAFHSVIFSDSGWFNSQRWEKVSNDNDKNLLLSELNITKIVEVCQPKRPLDQNRNSLGGVEKSDHAPNRKDSGLTRP
jgi:hypothetical protein